ncbi:DNA phosphorothioation-dependent restriction protein DptG [Pedobacter sp. Leaf170]|uniref:DNA phosphorothioation-dependent restriction protein DptG n=1 Tax=Pedobacter sp. Leaf170 TaxID=2876558 RepID=UPI001E4F5C2A|nr:DNA phosphorothioation-dependent restriction protein DptG [Pedobacter sp. Leaf170]
MSRDIEKAFKGYVTKKGEEYSLKHNPATFYRLFPYTTKLENSSLEKVDFTTFDGIIGHCYRAMTKVALPEDLPEESYSVSLKNRVTEQVLKKVKMESDLKDRFMTMIDSMFFNGEELAKFSPVAQAYLFWKKRIPGLINIADFIYEIFISPKVVAEWSSVKGFNENIFHTLINNALPGLTPIKFKKEQAQNQKEHYRRQIPGIIALFEQDFHYLYTYDKQGFLKESDKLFKLYYFLYVSQLGLLLNNFFEDHGDIKPLYFTLETETVSENRKTVKQGWRFVEPKIANLMSHSVALDILNRMELGGEQGYNYTELMELIEGFEEDEKEVVLADMDRLIAFYQNAVGPETKSWADFLPEKERIAKSARYGHFEKKIREFFQTIEFQFEHSTRKSKRKSFASWFVFFCKQNFLKNRGRNGYVFNLTQEMLIFMTRICIGNRPKIRLNELMQAFQNRGIYFDDSTKKAMIDIYEKINVIEKKSDSGDAQYIRQIL